MSRTALVIGAGQGMGEATALKLARNNIHVYLVGRTRSKLEAVAERIASEGGRSTVFPADVTQPGALDGLRDALESGLDIFVNCAGEALMNSFETTTLEDWQRIIDVNLTASFLTTQALLPYLRKSENASVILVVSRVALVSSGVVAYAAAKTGLLGFAKALAHVLKDEGIRVVPLCPGPTDTPMRWAATPDYSRDLVISPDTVAETIWYLVNLPRGTTTGEILVQSQTYS